MIVFDEAKLFNEPLKIKKVLSEDRAEMSGLQQSMLCGLIKEYKPKKILEVYFYVGDGYSGIFCRHSRKLL